MSLSLPTPSVSAGPGWASTLNTALTAIDAHDHAPGFGKPIRSAALSIDADVAWGGFNLTNLRSLRLVNHAAVLALGTDIGCVFESGGDLYWKNAAGQDVQITSGAGLNAASIGGIGGDYVGSGASVFYTSASQTFTFWQASNKWANLGVGALLIREAGATSPYAVTLQSPTSLAAAYALTLPPALPASTLPLLVSNTGVMSLAQLGTAQIADDAVATAKIPDGGVTGAKIATNVALNGKPTAAATVSADSATTLATKGYVDGLSDGASGIVWGTGWVASGGSAAVLVKQPNGIVTLTAQARRTSGSGTTVLTLPSGYRPAATAPVHVPALRATLATNLSISMTLGSSGTLELITGQTGWTNTDDLLWVSVTFKAA